MNETRLPSIGAMGMCLAILVIVCCALGSLFGELGEQRGVGTASRALLSAVGVVGARSC